MQKTRIKNSDTPLEDKRYVEEFISRGVKTARQFLALQDHEPDPFLVNQKVMKAVFGKSESYFERGAWEQSGFPFHKIAGNRLYDLVHCLRLVAQGEMATK